MGLPMILVSLYLAYMFHFKTILQKETQQVLLHHYEFDISLPLEKCMDIIKFY